MNTLTNNLIGLLIYILGFVILIPYLLLKSGFHTILESYLSNLDLVANLLSFMGGPLPGKVFEDLYNVNPNKNLYTFLSASFVNFLALLGITYLISRETKISGNIAYGWSTGFLLLLITYLLPSQFIMNFMSKVYDAYIDRNQIDTQMHGQTHSQIHINNQMRQHAYIMAFIGGTLFTIGLILFEKMLIVYNRKHLHSLAKYLIDLPKKII
jgi:hypothetical protein